MGLFTPVWKKEDAMGRKNMDKALAAVAKMTDQVKLAEVVRDAVRGEVALAAAEKLEDKSAVREWLKCEWVSDIGVREQLMELAAEGESQDWLKSFAMDYKNGYTSWELNWVLDSIESQDDIVDIAEHAPNMYVRRAATNRIRNAAIRNRLDAELTPLEEERDIAAVEASRKAKAQYEKSQRWRAEGRCPHCGVRLTPPQGGIPRGATASCSACGKQVY